MDVLDLRYPVLQAPIGAAASVELAAAISNAGGMGSLALTWREPDVASKMIQRLRTQTKEIFFVNYVLSFPTKSLNAALEAGAPVVTFSWGQPNLLIDRVHQSGAHVGVQAGTVDGAKQALDDGADFIICQGVEAGGHVQSTIALNELLPRVVEMAGVVPVVATGGLTDGADLAWALGLGAKAIMLGTRFVAVQESDAHDQYKQAIVDARSSDSVYTLCFDGAWPYAAHRALRNKTLETWESAGCPPAGQRPGENDIVARISSEKVIKRYSEAAPLQTSQGNILDCCLYAGTGCGNINDIPNAADLISSIWSEYEAC